MRTLAYFLRDIKHFHDCNFCAILSEGFSVAFDPLDGSSIVDTNFTVGTIFGVWPGDKLTGVSGRDQVAAAMGIFGPRTTYVLALKDIPGTHEFLLLDEGLEHHLHKFCQASDSRTTNQIPKQSFLFFFLNVVCFTGQGNGNMSKTQQKLEREKCSLLETCGQLLTTLTMLRFLYQLEIFFFLSFFISHLCILYQLTTGWF